MRALLKRYQIVIFFALTLIIGWFPWYANGQPNHKTLAPTVAGLIVVLLVGGWQGLLDYLRRAIRWRGPLAAWAVALLATSVVALASIGLSVLLGGQLPRFAMLTEPENVRALPMMILIWLLPLTGANQEFGLRGYGLPTLQERWGPLVGTLIIGTFFGAWMLPEFFDPMSFQGLLGLSYYPWFILLEIGQSTVMTWVFNKSRGSSLIAGYLFHAATNLWIVLLLVEATFEEGALNFG